MADYILMPKLGLTMTEGTIANWRKKEGDEIAQGEAIFDVETDKLTNEFESTVSGVLRKILVEEGTVDVLKPVAIIGTADEDISSLLGDAPQIAKEKQVDAPVKNIEEKEKPQKSEGRVKASPRAKKLAAEMGIDINMITGTGPQGSVTEKDVEGYSKQEAKENKVSPAAAVIADKLEVDLSGIQKDERIMKEDVIRIKGAQELEKFAAPQDFRKQMSPMRRVIAKRMLQSQQISPVVNYNLRVDATNLNEIRNQFKETGEKVTYTDLLVKILSKVLLEYPLLNASIEGDEIITRNYVNMGVAVALPDGLIVPVVKYSNVKDLKTISKEIKDLASRAKTNQLDQDEIKGGTFTITNVGMYGMESFTPIINQPEVAILGINAIIDTPVAVNKEVRIKPLMNLSLTADHRAVDGAVASAFMARLKEVIEKPGLLL
ncbi:dihydrolipoamide acetyltransferase family protein [Alkalibacter saccharofermentans]|uniref:Dihydrolipoamide acetyltransferase component of pyruvate dehydrogenase complex n=1 Tax=Alkalibacter saccharofermentans DSM 14828 TaxID=1120975 RepID=A0A1M4Y061_9FIRM|nr:dihydrolipoamide acetyltransferase family protein [Alkalibacter saccharofermentans]SHE98976.1 pyruvate dehydrogenase E2 component (dihydrolipoamide acetyltransferase) [Alkalibacter saccharofermentans DSM 14828]